MLLGSLAQPLPAAVNTVFLATNANWNVAAHWSLGVVPASDHNPILLNGRAAIVDATVPACGSAFIGQGSQSHPRGTVLVRPGATLVAANLFLGRDGTTPGLVVVRPQLGNRHDHRVEAAEEESAWGASPGEANSRRSWRFRWVTGTLVEDCFGISLSDVLDWDLSCLDARQYGIASQNIWSAVGDAGAPIRS